MDDRSGGRKSSKNFAGEIPLYFSSFGGQNMEQASKDPLAARKIQKADREKMRRDRLNEKFLELGNAVDPERPKNDKAIILTDTIQMLRDLATQVNRLKTEYATLSEESRELMVEKNELKEEKASLKCEIDELNVQYQQWFRVPYPWGAIDPSIMMGPHAYPVPVPVPIPSGPIPIHPMQPYPFFQNMTPGTILNPSQVQYSSPCIPQHEQPSTRKIVQHSTLLDSRTQSCYQHRQGPGDKSDNFSDVATELELKTPGSTISLQSKASQDLSSESRNGKRLQCKKGSSIPIASSSSTSSSCSVPESSCNGAGDGSPAEN